MKKIILMLLSFVILSASFSQIKETFETKQIAEAKRFVNFLFIKDGDGNLIPYGTGFFVGRRQDSLNIKIFMATAKHVLQDTLGQFIDRVFMRYNQKNGSFNIVELRLKYHGPNQNVFFHHDNTVDLAIIPILGDFSKVDFSVLFIENMLVKDNFAINGIAEGTDVFFSGMFASYLGYNRNYPISRFGKISLLPDEKVNFVNTMRDVIFLETTSYGGNSGSPVFVAYQSGNFFIRKLIGIMTGSYDQINKIGLLTNSITVSKENSGISVITPCKYLIELINSL